MILPESRSKDWIMKVREETRQRDPILIEKMIMALILVESLSINNLNFIFKGGTSLALLIGALQRFSIDIDIIMSDDQNIEKCFGNIIKSGQFTRYEENIRESEIPKKHYRFFFYSEIENRESHILLDILFEENLYSQLKQVEVSSPILSLGGEQTVVTCPTIECLLGDKLTAFAPNTTGIPYGTDKQLEMIKQLFDISILFDAVENLEPVLKTHAAISLKELGYRGMTHLSQYDVLQDTFDTSMLISLRGNPDCHDKFFELSDGIKRVGVFIFSGNFTIDKAILCASKAANLAAHLLKQEKEFRRFDTNLEISDWSIQNIKYNKINRLKKTNPEAFYYLYSALGKLDIVN
ncbi:MAG TPA: hypothetical protein DDX29_00495 [Clostridiales bacterium]|nr:hypothetical protein [Clostridiales bacterium]